MGKFRGPNQKATAAADKKMANQRAKENAIAEALEKQAVSEWSKGSNVRAQKRAESAAMKSDELARKKREKAALLLAEEEANMGSSKPKKTPTLSKKKNTKKNDLSLLEDALIGAADKKVKSKRASERQKAEKQRSEETRKQEQQSPVDPIFTNTQNMLKDTEDNLVGREANKALETEGPGGIDSALSALNVGGAGTSSEPTRKALYKAYETKMLIQLKAEKPGLKMSQYKEKIFNLWKKSPENPTNQQQ